MVQLELTNLPSGALLPVEMTTRGSMKVKLASRATAMELCVPLTSVVEKGKLGNFLTFKFPAGIRLATS